MLRLAAIEECSITDGPGVRVVIFTQGCKHNCRGCHNPDTHDMEGGDIYTVETIVNRILELEYTDGITLSGGDPFFQPKGCLELLKQLRDKTNLSVWAYTGFTYEAILNNNNQDMVDMLNYIDVLVDGPYVEEERSLKLKFKGSKNQRVIDVKKTLKSDKNGVIILDI